MREVLRLVGTKWNIPTYYPSVGTGGYCIPLSSQYVLDGTDRPDELSILTETIETDSQQPTVVAEAIVERGIESVAICGLAYKGDVKVDVLSPTRHLVEELQNRGVAVGVTDPYFDREYVEETTGARAIEFPEGLSGYESVVVIADHRKYEYMPEERVLSAIADCELVLDNPAIWEDLSFGEGTEYSYTGGRDWLGRPSEPRQ
jgi:UDP-N-acetyl-D-mannosaminuronate dehydrogenase